jgi:hypothetical protein
LFSKRRADCAPPLIADVMFPDRIAIAILSLIAAGCTAAGYSDRITVRSSDADIFLDPERLGTWSAPIGEYQYDVITALFKRAAHRRVPLSAVVVTQQGFHPVVYSLFQQSEVVVNFLYWGRIVGKGTASYDQAELIAIIAKLEDAGRCTNWSGVAPDDVYGDVLVHLQASLLRVCLNSDAFLGGGPTEIRDWFWAGFESKIVWSHYSYGKQET